MKFDDFKPWAEGQITSCAEALLVDMQSSDNPDWDVHDPMFFGYTRNEDGELTRGSFCILDSATNEPCGNLDDAMEGFRQGLQHVGAVVGALISGAWTKDPKTLERTGEAVILTLEDDDGNTAGACWPLLRSELGPPTLGEPRVLISSPDGEDSISGRMTGFFPAKDKAVLN